MSNHWTIICSMVVAIFLFPLAAHAYGDLVSASYTCQMILAGVLGGLFSIKLLPQLIMSRMKDWFRAQNK